VGSRWVLSTLPERLQAAGTTATLNSVNTLDNAEIYVPPFDPGETRSGNQALQRREQSLALEFTRLGVGDTLEAYKTFSIDENYSRYGKLDWFITGYDIPSYDPAADTLWYYVRFASDEAGRNYYEYRAPVPAQPGGISWARVSLPLTDLSNLKLRPDFPKTEPILFASDGAGGVRYVIRGRPSFTRLRRISFGLINGDGVTAREFPRGQLWFNEIRATDVARDVGRAGRMSLNGNVANLLQYNASWNTRDADFLSVGETRGLGSSQDQLNLNGTVQLHRFFEGTGIVLPFSYGYARSSSKPRFTAGDDVVRIGALAEASETRNETRTWSTSYQRSWGERSNPLLRYTLGGFTANLSRTESDGRNPNSVDTRSSTSAAVNWGIAPRALWSLGLPRTRMRFYPLPERIYWNYAITRTEGQSFSRSRDSTGALIPLQTTKGRTATIAFGGDSRPIDLFHHHFEGIRNLTLAEPLRETFGSINLGRVVQWGQSMDASYSFQRLAWFKPRLSWNAGYRQNNGPELSQDLSVRAVSNSQTMRASWDLPFDRMVSRSPTLPPPRPTIAARPDSLAPPDSAATPAAPRRSFQLRGLLARLGQITTDASVTQSSAHSRLTGTPSLPYLLGISTDPGLSGEDGRVQAQFGNQAQKGLQWSASARSRVDVGFGASMSTRAEFSSRRSELNAVVTRGTESTFPAFEVDYGRVPTVLQLQRVLSNARLRTNFSRSRSSDFQNSDDPTSTTTTTDWRPLLSVNGDLKNGTRTEVKVDRRVTVRENFQLGLSTTTTRNTDINLNLSRSFTQGQKVSMLGRETTVRSTITMGLSASYSRASSETIRKGALLAQLPSDEGRLSVRGTGSYGFSNNVTGNAALGFLQTNNYVSDIVRRSVTVELRASFTF
jgi:hypothetical protein